MSATDEGHPAMRRTTTAVSALLAAAAVLSTAVPALAAPSSVAARPVAARDGLQRALDAAVAAGIPGAVAEVRDESGVWRGSSGVTALDGGRAARGDERFRAGSVTKSFVATVVLQLVAEGELGLDDDIERHLPGLVPDGGHITVRQLLNHTSGLADYFKVLLPDLKALPTLQKATYTPRELVALAVKAGEERKGPKPVPGRTWDYSNTNYVVLGLLVEKVTGRSLGSEITRRLIRPLHLTGTSFPDSARLTGRHLNGYERLGAAPGAGPFVDFTAFNPSTIWAAGTLISTTHDLNRFYRALLGGELLPQNLLREMRTMQPMGDDRPGRAYGLGLEENRNLCAADGPVVGHTGSVAGYNTFSVTTADGKRQITLALSTDFTKTPEADKAANRVLITALCRS
ncbi:serine hydrolase domain-containing protein [Streptomyces cinnamoneus]|uniref:serine hydrolase domain-containing protein n=1 Tax=Streptomyces cinnamoneus TaxID=53446 RepID=UPI0037A49BBD